MVRGIGRGHADTRPRGPSHLMPVHPGNQGGNRGIRGATPSEDSSQPWAKVMIWRILAHALFIDGSRFVEPDLEANQASRATQQAGQTKATQARPPSKPARGRPSQAGRQGSKPARGTNLNTFLHLL